VDTPTDASAHAAADPREPEAPGGSPPAPTAAEVEGRLSRVLDPELRLSITELGMVRGVQVDPTGVVTVDVALTTAACPLRAQIQTEVAAAVRTLPGVTDVQVRYGEMTQQQRSRLMDRARKAAQHRAPDTEIPARTRILAIASGKGGVGKSSVTVNLAVALARRGYVVGLLDADIWGFSVPRMLGIGGRLRGEDGKIVPHEVPVAPGRLVVTSMGFLVDDETTALMWRGLILTKALEQFLTDVRWGDLDYLLIDMPPGTGDLQMGLARLLPRAELVVVTTPARAAQKVAARVADMARRSHLGVLGVVENMSELVLEDGRRLALFGEGGGQALAEELRVPLLARIPIAPDVAAGGDEGKPVAHHAPDSPAGRAFAALAERLAGELAPPVQMAGCTARLDALLQTG